jgi:hypothetical protein
MMWLTRVTRLLPSQYTDSYVSLPQARRLSEQSRSTPRSRSEAPARDLFLSLSPISR